VERGEGRRDTLGNGDHYSPDFGPENLISGAGWKIEGKGAVGEGGRGTMYA